MDETDYNYIWTKWIKAYEKGNFFEMDKESIETLLKARGFLRMNSVHRDAWEEFKKYIDNRQKDEHSKPTTQATDKDTPTSTNAIWKNKGKLVTAGVVLVGLIAIVANLTQILDFLGIKPKNPTDIYNPQIIPVSTITSVPKKEIASVAYDENFSPITLDQYLKGYKNDSLTNLQHETFIDTHIKKKVIWEGRIESVRHGSFGDYEVEFESENYPYYSVICKFNKEDKEDLLKLKSGQHIQVTGIFTDHSYNKLVLEDCRILRIE